MPTRFTYICGSAIPHRTHSTARQLRYRLMSGSSSSTTVSLTAAEAQFVDLLDDFARHRGPPIECRVAGGWVRDKLLSLPSSDLDIALTTHSGYGFAVDFVEYLKSRDIRTGSVGRVAANPEQSKHLETGTTTILGLDCDFVGLRSETYTDSRIPTSVQLGTPLEDALRRDLTINSLFYNVGTRQIEDFTGKGLEDLRQRIARTPLPPLQTFQDDPLRVLRGIRFASRFGLTIESTALTAMRDQQIQAALRQKVSKERVGIEIIKMLKHNPFQALVLIDELGLHSSIFTASVDPPRSDSLKSATILAKLSGEFPVDHYLWLAAAVSPFRDLVVQGKKPIPAVASVIGDGLKLSSETRTSVTNLFHAAKMMDFSGRHRSALGAVLQNAAVRPWRRSSVWTLVEEILGHGVWDTRADAAVARVKSFSQHVEGSGLDKAIDAPPLLNGHEIQRILQIKPSPLLRVVQKAMNLWQLDHPGATESECKDWLLQQWNSDGRIRWEELANQGTKLASHEKRKR